MGRPVAFGLLFFLLMHSVESSVLALEIYFEHRNYLPSLGLSISVAFLLAGLGRRLPQTCHAVLGLAAVYLVAHAAALASQVNVWTDRTSIAVAEIAAHPESARANRAMAVVAARAGHLEPALAYSAAGAAYDPGETSADRVARDLALHCLGDMPLSAAWLAATPPMGDIGSSSAYLSLEGLLRWKLAGRCPRLDFALLGDYLFDSVKVSPALAANQRFLLMARDLETQLGRDERVAHYDAQLRHALGR
jgi:hypothetical protein